MDHEEAVQTLGTLVHRATSKRLARLEPEHLSSIKALCRASNANVEVTFDLLYQRLKHSHSQVSQVPSHIPASVACRGLRGMPLHLVHGCRAKGAPSKHLFGRPLPPRVPGAGTAAGAGGVQ